jgi:hypothetical protein
MADWMPRMPWQAKPKVVAPQIGQPQVPKKKPQVAPTQPTAPGTPQSTVPIGDWGQPQTQKTPNPNRGLKKFFKQNKLDMGVYQNLTTGHAPEVGNTMGYSNSALSDVSRSLTGMANQFQQIASQVQIPPGSPQDAYVKQQLASVQQTLEQLKRYVSQGG